MGNVLSDDKKQQVLALGLGWSHVDLDAGTVDLAWSLQQIHYVHGCAGKCGRRPASCPQTRPSTQDFTDSSALGRPAGLVPPACAMSGRPPPLPPTCCAT